MYVHISISKTVKRKVKWFIFFHLSLETANILNCIYFILCRAGVSIGMKVLGADSMIQGTWKLWRMFPIKQKFDIKAANFYNRNVYNQTIFLIVHCATFFTPSLLHNGKKISKLDHIENFGLSKKTAVVWHFWLIGNICHNFPVPRMIESAPRLSCIFRPQINTELDVTNKISIV